MSDKWVMITGSNRGIGEKTLQKFASAGYNAFAHARTDSEDFRKMCEELSSQYNVQIEPLIFDMTDSEAMQEVMTKLRKDKRTIDVLVNNAGVMHAGLFQMTPMEDIRKVFDVNVFAMMELTGYVVKMMTRKKHGSIVNISSITGEDLGMGQCAYGVSKAAVSAFTKTLAAEMANYVVRVNAVAPGMAETRMTESASAQMQIEKMSTSKGLAGRIAQPEEVADAIYYLASDAASYINGQTLRVDGGNHLY